LNFGNFGGLSDEAKRQIADVTNTLNAQIKLLDSYSFTRATTSRSRGGSSSSKSSESDAAKAAEEAYKKRLEAFKNFVDERERLEKRWVDKQKELGQLSNKDYIYIIQQRIERYKKYLQEVKKATWMNAEDRIELEKKYSEAIEDLQVDYLGYLEDKLNDDIEALKKTNEEKIKLIEEEADARIDALKKVENENDRIRTKEEYLKKRQEHLDDISYWEQRTGREAQEALKEAKKNLKELDEEWQQQLEDWSIEDQIKAIESERDAQIKAIQDAQEAQIQAWQDIYNQRVKLFAETGQIIYDNATIQSQKLYETYRKNFVAPLKSDLSKLNNTNTQSTQKKKEYTSYKIKYGDTLSGIASRFNTTISKIMAANPSIKNANKIYSGDTIKIPKFHSGGIFGGIGEEGLALLKKGEVVLNPTWSASLNRMMRYFDNLSTKNQTNITNGPTIEVSGNLVNITASVRNQTDIDNIGKKVEKILKDKFNIKK
jgi:LysM repeat protein